MRVCVCFTDKELTGLFDTCRPRSGCRPQIILLITSSTVDHLGKVLLLNVSMLSGFPRGLDGVITSTSALALFRLDRDGSRYEALRVRMGSGRLGDKV